MTPSKPHPVNASKPAKAPTETLERIAREEMNIETLKTRNSGSLDFYEVAVWQLRDALEAAYQAGLSAASNARSK